MFRLIRGERSARNVVGVADELLPLAREAAAGSAGGLRTLLAAVTPRLLHVSRRVLGSAHPDVEDVSQEAALVLVARLSQFRGDCTVLHFAGRVALFTAMNARRNAAAKKPGAPPDAPVPSETVASASHPEGESASAELAEAVRELMLSLPEPLAEAFALHVVLDHTVAEIAEATGAPYETVRSRLKAARSELRRRVERKPRLREAARDLLRPRS